MSAKQCCCCGCCIQALLHLAIKVLGNTTTGHDDYDRYTEIVFKRSSEVNVKINFEVKLLHNRSEAPYTLVNIKH